MTDRECLTTLARGFMTALAARNMGDLTSLLHPDVDWVIYGPIDMFPFLGAHRGRDEVAAACAALVSAMQVGPVMIEREVFSGHSASMLLRCTFRPVRVDHSVSVRLAVFVRLQDRLIGDVRVVVDTFDLVEQSLGREINLPVVA